MRRQAVTDASTGADRRNRAGLSLLGIVFLAVGGYALARGWGAFGAPAAHQPVLDESWRRFAGRNGGWFWAVVAVASVLLALVGLRWLRAQLAGASPREIDLTHRGDDGITMVHPAGAAQALAVDIERFPGVVAASARLIGDREEPEVHVRVEIDDRCNLPALRARIENEALGRFQEALEFEAIEASLEFRAVPPTRSRVG